MTRVTLSLLFTHLLKRTWKNDGVQSKIFWKSSVKFTFGQDDCHK